MDDEENVNGAAAVNAKGGNGKAMGLVIALLLVLIAVIVGVAFMVLGALGDTTPTGGVTTVEAQGLTPEDITHVTTGLPIVTNLLTDPNGREWMVVFSFTVGVNNTTAESSDLIRLLENSEPILRNIGLNVVRDVTGSELNARGGATLVSNEILRRVQDEFRSNLITDIMIVDLTTQPL